MSRRRAIAGRQQRHPECVRAANNANRHESHCLSIATAHGRVFLRLLDLFGAPGLTIPDSILVGADKVVE